VFLSVCIKHTELRTKIYYRISSRSSSLLRIKSMLAAVVIANYKNTVIRVK
jgi:hypothetical protein